MIKINDELERERLIEDSKKISPDTTEERKQYITLLFSNKCLEWILPEGVRNQEPCYLSTSFCPGCSHHHDCALRLIRDAVFDAVEMFSILEHNARIDRIRKGFDDLVHDFEKANESNGGNPPDHKTMKRIVMNYVLEESGYDNMVKSLLREWIANSNKKGGAQ